MGKIWDFIINLSTGVLGSIIASMIVAFFLGWSIIRKSKRKSKLQIKGSMVKGDVVGGDKKSHYSQNERSKERRDSHILVVKSEVGGDIVIGDKEK